MSPRVKTAPGKNVIAHWNELGILARLKLILEYQDLFLALRLITSSEVQMAESMSPTEWEYILGREIHPIFTSVDLKEDVKDQLHVHKLLTALQVVFL